jgi:D-glycero-D-manno-heptose 1,7-bisphosphate phosphatase
MHILRLGTKTKNNLPLMIFDRDGTLNIDEGYSYKVEDIRLTPFAQCIQPIFQEYRVMAAIASNQSGIAHNFFKAVDFDLFTKELVTRIDPSRRSFFLAIACPHLPDELCLCRKPNTAMLEAITHEDNFTDVIMIGNSKSDELAAKNAHIMYLDCNDENACTQLYDWVELRCDNK